MKREFFLIASMVLGLVLQCSAQYFINPFNRDTANDDNKYIEFGDVDNDGDEDVIITSSAFTEYNEIWLNDGFGNFSPEILLQGATTFGAKLGDLDGDGDLDLFVANLGSSNQVWINDGSGNFTNTNQVLGNNLSTWVDLGDVDNDGDLDAFVTNYGLNKLWLNDGSGNFTDSGLDLGDLNSTIVRLADLDGDNDIDAFVCNEGTGNQIWINNGAGLFSDSGQSLGSGNSWGLDIGDVDNDGDLDAFVGNSDGQSNKLWINNSSGFFTAYGVEYGTGNTTSIKLADLDNDDDLDAYITNAGEPNEVWINEGSGLFTLVQSVSSSYNNSDGVDFSDIDGDGDLDAFVCTYQNKNQIWENCLAPTLNSISATQTNYCSGDNTETTLSVNGNLNDGVEWQWYNGTTEELIGTGASITVTPTETTTYELTYDACSLEYTPAETITITVNPLPTVIAGASEVIVCEGESIILTGSGTDSYSWSNGVIDGVAFTASETTTYTVTGTSEATGCSNTDDITITVHPLPDINIDVSATEICEGESVTLTATGDATFSWSGGVINGEPFTPLTTDSYKLTAVGSNGCLLPPTMVTVEVYPTPTVVANVSSTDIMGGESVILTGSGANTYIWDNNAIDGEPIIPLGTTIYTVVGANEFGCEDSDQVTVNVTRSDQTISFNALADKTYADISFELSATASSQLAITYTSSNESVAIIDGSTVNIVGTGETVITASQAGNDNYYAAESISHTLVVNKASQTITFDAIPTLGIGETYNLVAYSSSGLAVSFESSDETIASITNNSLDVHAFGEVTITASQSGNENYLAANTESQTLVLNTITDIDKDISDMVTAYPNPITDQVHIKGIHKIDGLSLYSALGRKIDNVLWRMEDNQLTIEMDRLMQGIYILTIQSDKHMIQKYLYKK